MGEIKDSTMFYLFLLICIPLVFSMPTRITEDATSTISGYKYSCYGDCTDVVTKTTPGLFLQGGGTNIDAGYQFLIERSGGGNFLVIRATDGDDYTEYIYNMGGIQSVSNLLITTVEGANSDFVYNTIMEAEALFIVEHDQWAAIKVWNNTRVKKAINAIAQNGVPLGGTSAGFVILGQYLYTAQNGSCTSDEALNNPYGPEVTLGTNFLNISSYVTNVIFDGHLAERDRMGRLVTFLARLIQDNDADKFVGIGMDEEAALLVDETGQGTLVNLAMSRSEAQSMYIVTPTQPPTVCQPGTPLDFEQLQVVRVSYGDIVNMNTLVSNSTAVYFLSANSGNLESTQPGGFIY